jgi:large subunit ribosomal protein L7/L12
MGEVTDKALQNLLKKREQLEAKIQKRMAVQNEKKRKEDTRRKIIAGGVCLKLMQDDEHLKNRILAKIKSTTKPQEFERLFSDFAGKEGES